MRSVLVMLAVLILAAVGVSCATPGTSLFRAWQPDRYANARLKRVLVVAVGKRPEGRQMVENAFVKVLQDEGIEAVACHTLLPGEAQAGRDAFLGAVRDSGADAVLIGRALSVKEGFGYAHPATLGQGTGWDLYGEYAAAWKGFAEAPEATGYGAIKVELKLCGVAFNDLVWIGLTQTMDIRDYSESAHEFAKIVMDDLVNRRLLAPVER